MNETILVATSGGEETLDHEILAALDAKRSFADVVTGDARRERERLERMTR